MGRGRGSGDRVSEDVRGGELKKKVLYRCMHRNCSQVPCLYPDW